MKLIAGAHGGAPVILVPRSKTKLWEKRIAADGWLIFNLNKGVAAPVEQTQHDGEWAVGFATEGAHGWIPSDVGGAFVYWTDAAKKGTGTLPDAKVHAEMAKLRKGRHLGSITLSEPLVLTTGKFGPKDKFFNWIDVPLSPGSYDITYFPPRKTSMGSIGFVQLTRQRDVVAAGPRTKAKPELEATEKKLATVNVEGTTVSAVRRVRRGAQR